MHPARLTAKMHTVEARWRLRTTRSVTIGPTPRMVLMLTALRDVELLYLRVDFPELETLDAAAESILAELSPGVGLRRLKPEGEPWVKGQEDAPGAPFLAVGKPGGLLPISEIRWHGGLVESVQHNVCRHPCIYWVWKGRAAVPKGKSVGLLVECDKPTACRAQLAGV